MNLAATIWMVVSCLANADQPKKQLPFPGEVFAIEGRTAFLIQPDVKSPKEPMPWVWYAPTLRGLPGGAEKWMFERFLKAGIAIAGIDVGESYGSPKGRALYPRCTSIWWRSTAWPSRLVCWHAAGAG